MAGLLLSTAASAQDTARASVATGRAQGNDESSPAGVSADATAESGGDAPAALPGGSRPQAIIAARHSAERPARAGIPDRSFAEARVTGQMLPNHPVALYWH